MGIQFIGLNQDQQKQLDNFIRDYQQANPKGADLPVASDGSTVLMKTPKEQILSGRPQHKIYKQ